MAPSAGGGHGALTTNQGVPIANSQNSRPTARRSPLQW
jgi:hypothetical protein